MTRSADDPQKFYAEVIMPYKGEVERWYLGHRSLRTYFTIILVTAWVIIAPKSGIAWRVFPGLPKPPAALERFWG